MDPLVRGVAEVVKTCTVNELGIVRHCAGEAEKELDKLEQAAGPVPALARYCEALSSEKDRKLQALVATRMGGLSQHSVLAEKGTDTLLDCLVKLLPHLKDHRAGQGVLAVRPAAFLATARSREQELLGYLDKDAPPAVKRVGYECLWPNGGLRILPHLEKALASSDQELRRAILVGFAYKDSLTAEESSKVCGLLGGLLGDADLTVAGRAADRLAALCPDHRRAVLAAAVKRLSAQELGFVNALRSLLGSARDAKERKAVLAALTRVVSTPERPPKSCPTCARPDAPGVARRAALKYIAESDPKLAAALERKHFPRAAGSPAK
ncbi:MAG: hypothetical protein ACOY3Y_15015 [Acidobacteriota bacterium]